MIPGGKCHKVSDNDMAYLGEGKEGLALDVASYLVNTGGQLVDLPLDV